jgi:general secretion pathway protein G
MERRKSDEASEYGFTLIELLIVIIVIGILAAIVVFSLTGVSGQSKTAACTSDAKSVEIAADAWQTKNSTDTETIGSLVTGGYLKTAPVTTNGYVISLSSGTVMVAVNGGAAAAFDDSTGCPAVN